jgi:hypothetical protein
MCRPVGEGVDADVRDLGVGLVERVEHDVFAGVVERHCGFPRGGCC